MQAADAVHAQIGVEYAARGVGVGAGGAERMEGQQFQVARAQALGRDAGGERQVDLARAGGFEELLQAAQADPELGDVGLGSS